MENIFIDDKTKEFLRKPFGKVFRSIEELSFSKPFITVGDFSLSLFLKNSIKPDIAVIDFKTQRSPIEKEEQELFLKTYKNKIYIENKPSNISIHSQILPFLLKNLNKDVLVVVRGEEDLVAIPLLIHLIKDFDLIYGIRGIGGVKVSLEYDSSIKSIEQLSLLLSKFNQP